MAGLTWDELESEASAVYRAARADVTRGAAPSILARAVLGPGRVVVVPPAALPGGGALARVGSEWRVYLRQGLPAPRQRFVLAHELAHYLIGPTATEDDADNLAAALLAPRPAFERAIRAWDERSHTPLARWFVTDESFAAMRFAEVSGSPTSLVTPLRVRLRGTSYSWPSESELRALAGSRQIQGLRKVRLRDDPGRVVMRAG